MPRQGSEWIIPGVGQNRRDTHADAFWAGVAVTTGALLGVVLFVALHL